MREDRGGGRKRREDREGEERGGRIGEEEGEGGMGEEEEVNDFLYTAYDYHPSRQGVG